MTATTETGNGHWMVEREGTIHFSTCRHCPDTAAVYRDAHPKSLTEMLTHIEYTPYLVPCQECMLGRRYG